MPVRLIGHRGARIALGAVGVLVALLVLAQLLLPKIAAKIASNRLTHYGTVKSVSVSALPAIELLWGKADSASVRAGALTFTPAQLTSLLWESRNVDNVTMTADATSLRVASIPHGITMSDVRTEKHGSALQAYATLTQQQLDAALPAGFHVEPVASGAGSVEVRASGALFGVQATITALVRPLEGRLVAEPQGFPFAGLATVTLFSDPHLRVQSVGVRLQRQPLAYGLSMRGTLQ